MIKKFVLFLWGIVVLSSLCNGDKYGDPTMMAFFLFVITVPILSFTVNISSISNKRVLLLPIPLPILLFVFFTLYICLSALIKGYGLGWYPFYIVCCCLLLISAYFYFASNENNTNSFFVLVMLFAITESIVCFFQFFGIINSQNTLFTVTGTWVNPNVTAMFLAMAIPATMATYSNSKAGLRKLSFFGLLMLWGALFMLNCRSAIIGALISTTIILNSTYSIIQKVKEKSGSKKFILLCAAVLLFIVLIGTAFYFSKNDSTDGRKFIWRISYHMISDNPITGYGYGMFEHYYNLAQAKYFENAKASAAEIKNSSYVQTSYNELIQNVLDGGIIGLILFLAFFATLMLSNLIFPIHKDKSNNSIITYSGIVAFFTMSCVNFTMLAIPVMCLFIAYVGIYVAGLMNSKAAQNRNEKYPLSLKLNKVLNYTAIFVSICVCVCQLNIAKASAENKQIISIKSNRIKEIILENLSATLQHSELFWVNYGDVYRVKGEIITGSGTVLNLTTPPVQPPVFPGKLDGLGITVDNVWSARADLVSLKVCPQDRKFAGVIKYTLTDDYGLDQQDVIHNNSTVWDYLSLTLTSTGFHAWYILQHIRCNETYLHRPFLTRIVINGGFTGTW